jgi:hypothetical protein
MGRAAAPWLNRRRGTERTGMAAAEQAGSVETRTSGVVTVAAVVILSVSFGAPLIVVVALPSIAADLGEARAVPALASSLAYLGAGAGGVLMGWLAGRVGTRPVAVGHRQVVVSRPPEPMG